VAASVASWSGRKSISFSDVASETVCGAGVSVRVSPGRGWGDVEGSMPCRIGCGAGLGGLQVHGNAVVRSAQSGRSELAYAGVVGAARTVTLG
jgi:hypothetical protein